MMAKAISLHLFFALFISFNIHAEGILQGKITDSSDNTALIGVNIITLSEGGTSTDLDGNYKLRLTEGIHKITFSYLGYQSKDVTVEIRSGSEKTLNLQLKEEVRDLNIVVVSASKYEKNLGEETVSIEILRPEFIENSSPLNLQESLNKISGLNMIGEQVNIRGGSGYTAGAASRVLVLLDDMPMIGPENGTIEWNALPIENIEQIEVIKGAASSLYGSSALNGIINVRTANPRSEPYSRIMFFSGIYDNPKDKDKVWWGKDQPYFNGASLAHRRRIGNFDLVLGGNYLSDKSYLKNNYSTRLRGNFKTSYRFQNIEGLTVGLDGNAMLKDGSVFFIWQGKDSLAFIPSQSNELRRRSLNIDPYITYFDSKGNRHSLKTRYFSTQTRTNTTENSDAEMYYGEYNFTKLIPSINLNFTVGTSGSFSNIVSETFNDHESWNYATFAQIDKKFFNRLTFSFGTRYEVFSIDDEVDNSGFLFRGGANFMLREGTFLRGSYGQGYRYPTIAEKFVETVRGGINVFPNPDIEPESGWSAEMGVKQMFRVSNWVGYLDFSAFLTEYRDMIEFVLISRNSQLGFVSKNVSDARISGFEFSGFGTGDLFGLPTNIIFGYTYINPIDLIDTTDSGAQEILKYRFRHSAKFDAETTYKNVFAGFTMTYNSFMERIDPAFALINGLREYREENSTGDWVIDFRLGYNISERSKLLFIAKNLLNREYSLRPAYIEPPRNFTVQFSHEF